MNLASLVYWQLGLILLMTCYTAGLLIFRERYKRFQKRIESRLAEEITNELCNFIEKSPPPFRLPQPPRRERRITQDYLVQQIRILSGPERAYLAHRYKKMGFIKVDLEYCKSSSWTRRLRALTHLGSFDDPGLAPVFWKMTGDRNGMVAAYASLALSNLKHRLNGKCLIESLPQEILNRKHALLELLLNFGKNNGLKAIEEVILETSSATIAEAAMQALLRMKNPESLFFVGHLLQDPRFKPALLCEMIDELAKIGDPLACDFVQPLIHHADEKVRASAQQILMLLREDEGRLAS